MERLVITYGAREVFEKVNSEVFLSRKQKRALTSILQNPDVEISGEDIDEWGADIGVLRKEEMTKTKSAILELNIKLVLDYLDSCIIVDDLPF